ncbi:MAG: hypothetical protein GC182_13325 [Rhodopseudomonas sp.]|nr:hypothetical protein [Rhodopseudomonas sp.]
MSALVVIGVLFGPAGSPAAPSASGLRPPIDYRSAGIRFQILASIKATSEIVTSGAPDNRDRASLAVKLRISTHAVGSNFFGEITQTFADFRLSEGSGDRLFWQDTLCHQRRGFPKITVVAVDGSIGVGRGMSVVKARPRHIGVLLPADEIGPGRREPAIAGQGRTVIVYRSQTRSSHLAIDVKTIAIDCPLVGSAG